MQWYNLRPCDYYSEFEKVTLEVKGKRVRFKGKKLATPTEEVSVDIPDGASVH